MSTIDRSRWSYDDGCIPSQGWFVRKILDPVRGLTLDCGCGRGIWSRKIREKGLPAVSLDPSIRRLRMCRCEDNNILVICASCTHLPFRPDSFDSILLLEVIEHLTKEEQKATLEGIRGVLKTGGTLVLTTPNKHIYRLLGNIMFTHNPEHLNELTLGECKRMLRQFFRIRIIDGKLGILDRLVPSFLCWDLLFVCENPGPVSGEELNI